MYEEILNSKHLSQSLCVFMHLPQRAYSISETAKVFRLSVRMSAGILNTLTAHNFLKSVTKHNKKYFYYKPSIDVPSWFKSKLLKPKKKLEDPLFEDLKKLALKGVFLTGIFCGLPNLPVDLLLVGRVDLKKLNKFLDKWQQIMGLELNYSIMSEEEFVERRNTFDKFIKDIFDHRNLVVVDRLGKK